MAATEEALKRRETAKQQKRILRNPKIAVGELTLVSKVDSAGTLQMNKLDSAGTLKKNNSSGSHTVTESAGSLSKNISTRFSSVMSFNEVDLTEVFEPKKLMKPRIVIGNLVQTINEGDNTYNFLAVNL